MKFSVIIPTYNADSYLKKCILSVKNAKLDNEIIVVDGGSNDMTEQIALAENTTFLKSKKGRGLQLIKGANHARGEILIFLHSDTLLPKMSGFVLKKYFNNYNAEVGSFLMKFDQNHWLLKLYSLMTRYDSIWTSFGDQCIVCKKSFYQKVGGFPPWDLFEDVNFLQKARKLTKVYVFPIEITTSSEKFLRNGVLRQQLKNGLLILRYLMGTNPNILSKKYGY